MKENRASFARTGHQRGCVIEKHNGNCMNAKGEALYEPAQGVRRTKQRGPRWPSTRAWGDSPAMLAKYARRAARTAKQQAGMQ